MESQKNTVLIVDDDPSICKLIARVCTKFRYVPMVVPDRDEFEAAMGSQNLCLVITDLQMPEFDGIEFMNLLASERTDVPVVILSGFDPRVLQTAKSFARSVGLTVLDALKKPLSVEDLGAVLDRAKSRVTP